MWFNQNEDSDVIGPGTYGDWPICKCHTDVPTASPTGPTWAPTEAPTMPTWAPTRFSYVMLNDKSEAMSCAALGATNYHYTAAATLVEANKECGQGSEKWLGWVPAWARRTFAEHLIATQALRCTATAWILTFAESFANF